MDNFDDELSANSESVAEDKTTIKENRSEETETDDEKASDCNDGMDIKDGKDNYPNDAQISSEVDDIVGSKTKSEAVGDADGIDKKGKTTKKKNQQTGLERFSTR